MKFSHLLLFAAGVTLLTSAHAQQATPAAADANAPVPPLKYRSVFADVVAPKAAQPSPDRSWVRANQALLTDDPAPSASGEKSAAGTSQKETAPPPSHGQREHKGMHQ